MPFKDKQKYKEYQKEYHYKLRQTDKGRKYGRIVHWKNRGVIFSDYDLLYDIYINTEFCNLCKVKLTEDKIITKTTRCLDHDHTITDCENVRNILCHSCNAKDKSKHKK